MTIVEALEEATKDANIRTFGFANIEEFNAFSESFKFNDYPANIVVPFDNNGTWLNGRRKATVPIQGWILMRINDTDIPNYKTAEVEKKFLQPMRALAIKFLRNLIDSDVVDPEREEITDKIVPEYMFLDQNLFGVSYTINLPTTESIC